MALFHIKRKYKYSLYINMAFGKHTVHLLFLILLTVYRLVTSLPNCLPGTLHIQKYDPITVLTECWWESIETAGVNVRLGACLLSR